MLSDVLFSHGILLVDCCVLVVRCALRVYVVRCAPQMFLAKKIHHSVYSLCAMNFLRGAPSCVFLGT